MHTLPKASAAALYDDPAFSLDPRTHPYFAANITPWATPFQPQPGFIAQPGLPHLTIQPDTDEAQLLQPPNTPMFSDDHSSSTHETNSSSNHTSTSFASLSTPPTSTDSHSSPWTSIPPEKPAQPLPWPPESQQRRKLNLAMFWRKSPPETVLEPVGPGRHVLPDPPPQISVDRPTPARFVSMPEAVKLLGRPTLPPRSATTAVDSRPPPTASHRIIGGVAIRSHELDRIDELDESSPMGLSLHHGGPYEAIPISHKSSSQQETILHNIGSQYQVNSPSVLRRSVDRNRSQGSKAPGPVSVPIIPAGVSLNLKPGQILPRNFYQNTFRSVEPSDAPQWPPQSPRSQPGAQLNQGYQWQADVEKYATIHSQESAYIDGNKRSGHEQSALPEYSLYPTDMAVHNNNAPSAQIQFLTVRETRERSKKHSSSIESFQYQRPPPNGGQSTSHFRAPTPLHRAPSNPRLPPRMQALQMQNVRPDESHRRSPRPHNPSQDHKTAFMETTADYSVRRRRSVVPGQVPHTFHMDADQLPTTNAALNVVSSMPEAPRLFDQTSHLYNTTHLQRHDPDSESSHRSLHGTSSTSVHHPRNSRFIPPSHVPKRLIMPAPLQQSQSLVPMLQSEPPPGQPDFNSWQPHMRTSSDTTNSQIAKDAAFPPSGKLRKRNSVQGIIPQTPYISPSQPLTFEPTSLYISAIPQQPAPPNRKLERAHKNVLSKRRTAL